MYIWIKGIVPEQELKEWILLEEILRSTRGSAKMLSELQAAILLQLWTSPTNFHAKERFKFW